MIRVNSVFVILAHSGAGPVHYDLMLRLGGVLATWRLPCPPQELPAGQTTEVARLDDHRAAYLDYQGPISGGRGEVARIDEGPCELIEVSEDRWLVRLAGKRARGRYELRRISSASERWSITPPATPES